MVNYSKGYSFEQTTRIKKGSWISGQSKTILTRIMDRPSI